METKRVQNTGNNAMTMDKVANLHCPFVWKPDLQLSSRPQCIFKKFTDDYDQQNMPGISFRSLIIGLIQCYEYYCQKDIKQAKISYGHLEEFLVSQTKNDYFYISRRDALNHVIKSCEVYLHKYSKKEKEALEILKSIKSYEAMNKRNQATIWSIKACICAEYGYNGIIAAVGHLNMAIELDQKCDQWYFFKGMYLGRQRRIESGEAVPTEEEIKAFETAMNIKERSNYAAFIAEVYQELADRVTRKYKNKEQKSEDRVLNPLFKKLDMVNKTAASLFKKSISLEGENPHLLFRCGKGLMKLPQPYRDLNTARVYFQKGLKADPKSSYGNHCMAMYYEKHEKNYQLALKYLRAAARTTNFPARMDLLRLEFVKTRDTQVLHQSLLQMLETFHESPKRSKLLAELVSFHLFLDYDLVEACLRMKQLLSQQSKFTDLSMKFRSGILPLREAIPLFDILCNDVKRRLNNVRIHPQEKIVLEKFIHRMCLDNKNVPDKCSRDLRKEYLDSIESSFQNTYEKKSQQRFGDNHETNLNLNEARKNVDKSWKKKLDDNDHKRKESRHRQYDKSGWSKTEIPKSQSEDKFSSDGDMDDFNEYRDRKKQQEKFDKEPSVTEINQRRVKPFKKEYNSRKNADRTINKRQSSSAKNTDSFDDEVENVRRERSPENRNRKYDRELYENKYVESSRSSYNKKNEKQESRECSFDRFKEYDDVSDDHYSGKKVEHKAKEKKIHYRRRSSSKSGFDSPEPHYRSRKEREKYAYPKERYSKKDNYQHNKKYDEDEELYKNRKGKDVEKTHRRRSLSKSDRSRDGSQHRSYKKSEKQHRGQMVNKENRRLSHSSKQDKSTKSMHMQKLNRDRSWSRTSKASSRNRDRSDSDNKREKNQKMKLQSSKSSSRSQKSSRQYESDVSDKYREERKSKHYRSSTSSSDTENSSSDSSNTREKILKSKLRRRRSKSKCDTGDSDDDKFKRNKNSRHLHKELGVGDSKDKFVKNQRLNRYRKKLSDDEQVSRNNRIKLRNKKNRSSYDSSTTESNSDSSVENEDNKFSEPSSEKCDLENKKSSDFDVSEGSKFPKKKYSKHLRNSCEKNEETEEFSDEKIRMSISSCKNIYDKIKSPEKAERDDIFNYSKDELFHLKFNENAPECPLTNKNMRTEDNVSNDNVSDFLNRFKNLQIHDSAFSRNHKTELKPISTSEPISKSFNFTKELYDDNGELRNRFFDICDKRVEPDQKKNFTANDEGESRHLRTNKEEKGTENVYFGEDDAQMQYDLFLDRLHCCMMAQVDEGKQINSKTE